jgi:hypothetical protein
MSYDQACGNKSGVEVMLTNIEQQLSKLPKPDRTTAALRRAFVQEIRSIASHDNPKVSPDVNYVFVLSGRGSYLKRPVDRPDIADREDDYNRMRLGINIARTITAFRLGKEVKDVTNAEIASSGPIIIYNGRPKHNEDFKKALADKVITDYPPTKFLVLDLPPDQLNSKGHFLSIKQNLDLSNQELAIVTSAFHFPRIGRMLSNQGKFNYFGSNVKIYAYLYDREFKAPGTIQDLMDEAQKIPAYIAKGDLDMEISKAVTFNGPAPYP